jgi:hypothetical protein
MLDRPPRYRKLNAHLKQRFGERVYRVGLRGGFTCPNRDGALGTGGCTFCNPESSRPLGHIPGAGIGRQLEEGIAYVRRRHRAHRFIAYFSDYTSTHADVSRLRRLYEAAIDHPEVVGLALGTRPDCLDEPVLDLLQELSTRTWLSVEIGVQSACDATLARVRRGHCVETSRRAIDALSSRGITVAAHVILGLPGEGATEVLETARFVADAPVDAIKVHGLHVVEGTGLADEYRRGELRVMSLGEYVEMAVDFLENLPPEVIIQRLTGEAPRRLTLAPEWSINKLAVVNAIESRLNARDTWQGKALGHPREAISATLEGPVRPPGSTVHGRGGSGRPLGGVC